MELERRKTGENEPDVLCLVDKKLNKDIEFLDAGDSNFRIHRKD